jgi:hypothetical protein
MENKSECDDYFKASNFFHKEYVKCIETNNNLKSINIFNDCNELYEMHKKYEEKYTKEIEKGN